MWAAEANGDIGFRFTLQGELDDDKEEHDPDLQLRDFNLETSLNPSTSTPCMTDAGKSLISNLQVQKPNRGGEEETEVFENESVDDNQNRSHANNCRSAIDREEQVECDRRGQEMTKKDHELQNKHSKSSTCKNCGTGSQTCTCLVKNGDAKYQCPNCDFDTKYRQNLYRHMAAEKIHLDKGRNRACNRLSRIRQNSSIIRQNSSRIRQNSSRKRLQSTRVLLGKDQKNSLRSCGSCDFKTSKLRNLKRHILLTHFNKEEYLEKYCNYRKGKYMKSGQTCHKCGKKWRNASQLWMHMCAQHGVVSKGDLLKKIVLGLKKKSSKSASRDKDFKESKGLEDDTGSTSLTGAPSSEV